MTVSDLLVADTNEYHAVTDAGAYGAWSPAIIMRAHNGYREDYSYQSSRAMVEAAPAIRARGHYGYVVDVLDAGQQGRDFGAIVRNRGGIRPGDFISWDIEAGAGDQAARAAAWLAGAHSVLLDPVADEFGYSGANYWTAHLGSVEGVHRWIAAYGQAEPNLSETLWQFTDKQNAPGVSGPCDCSVFHGTIDEFLALINPRPAAPYAPPAPSTIGGTQLQQLIAEIPVGPTGEGFAVFDGGINSDPGSTSLSPAIPIGHFVSATPWGPDPVHDPDWGPIHLDVQNRNGWLFLHVRNAPPQNPAAPVTVAMVAYQD